MTSLRATRHPRVRLETRAALQPSSDRTAPNGQPYDHRFIASTELMASDRGIIPVAAWRLQGWLQRPRWIANHDLGGFAPLNEVALGRGVFANVETGLPADRVGPSGKALVAYVRYASTPFAQEVRTLYEEGGLDDVSVRWDWRTEQLREPDDSERAVWGDELSWVAERADLVELSAVMLGADTGAQLMRRDVEAALERCRTAGHRLPLVENMLLNRGRVSVSGMREESTLDVMGAADAVQQLNTALGGLGTWLGALGPLRHEVADSITGLKNLVTAARPSQDADANLALAGKLGGAAVNLLDLEDVEPEPPIASAEMARLDETLSRFDLASGVVGRALTAVSAASQAVAAALGLGDVVADDRELLIDVEAVLRDAGDEFTIGDREVAIDLSAILHGGRDNMRVKSLLKLEVEVRPGEWRPAFTPVGGASKEVKPTQALIGAWAQFKTAIKLQFDGDDAPLTPTEAAELLVGWMSFHP